jgi:response regulator RpfG family c-di-GMP phosphodiesterase
MSAERTAVVVGFAASLGDALGELLRPQGFTVHRLETELDAVAFLSGTVVDLVIASGRCQAPAVVELVAALGEPRVARVLVLLAGRDAEAERRYREAGLKHIMRMPVTAAELLRAGGLAGKEG